MDKNMDRPIEDMRLAQIGFLVNDIEKTKKEFARFFGAVILRLPIPNTGANQRQRQNVI